MFNKPKNHYAEFMEGILVGGAVGAVATFILGTTKGRRLQKQMLHKYRKLGENLESRVGHLRSHMKKVTRKVMKSKVARKVKKTMRHKKRKSRR